MLADVLVELQEIVAVERPLQLTLVVQVFLLRQFAATCRHVSVVFHVRPLSFSLPC